MLGAAAARRGGPGPTEATTSSSNWPQDLYQVHSALVTVVTVTVTPGAAAGAARHRRPAGRGQPRLVTGSESLPGLSHGLVPSLESLRP